MARQLTATTASCLRVVGSGRVRVNVVGPTSPITVPSMYNGDTYECFVTATNIIGTSPASATSEPFVVGAPDTFAPPPSSRHACPNQPTVATGHHGRTAVAGGHSGSCVKPEPLSSPPSAGFLLSSSPPSFSLISVIASSPATRPPDADGHRTDGHIPASFRRSNASSISAP